MVTDARIELWKGDAWADATGDRYERNRITIKQGRQNQGSAPDPARCGLTLNNRGGKYSPRNPMSPYFGVIGRNTPLRVSVAGTESYLALDGSDGGCATTAGSLGLGLSTALDVRIEFTVGQPLAGAARTLIGQQDGSAEGWVIRFTDTGNLNLFVATTGGDSGVQAAFPYTASRVAARAVWVADDGTGTARNWLYMAPSLDGPWTELAEFSEASSGTLVDSTLPIQIAPAYTNMAGAARPPLDGWVHRAEVRSLVDASVIAAPDFRDLAPGTTSWTDSVGMDWSLAGTAAVSDRAYRYIGEVSEWPPRRDLSGKDVYCPIEAYGITRRLGEGSRPLQSTLRRQIPALSPAAYWPMEDGASATSAASPIDGVASMFVEGVDWSTATGLPSSEALPVIRPSRSRAGLYGAVPPPETAPTAWQMEMVYRIDTINTTARTIIRIMSTGTVAEWLIDQGEALTNVIGYDAGRNLLFTYPIGTGTDLYKQWIELRFTARQDGGNVAWEISWRDVGGDAGFAFSSWPGVVGAVSAVGGPVIEVGGYSTDLDGMSLGHIAVWHDNEQNRFAGAITAWTGETAAARMLRLAAEDRLPLAIAAGEAVDTEAVGPQAVSTWLDLIKLAAETDGGILYDRLDVLGLAYRPRASMYTQPAAMVLDYSSGRHVMDPFDPVDDIAGVANDITVTRDGGSSGRAVRETGANSVQPPPDGAGHYPKSVPLSLDNDAQTTPLAAWLVHLSTWDEARYPSVRIALHRAPELRDAALRIVPGDRITITNLPDDLPPENAELIVVGWTESIGIIEHDITYNCIPARPWMIGTLDHPVYSHVDTDGSELAAAVDADDTTLVVAATDGPAWVVAEPAINADPTFQQGIGGWTGNGAEIDVVDMPSPVEGARVLAIDPDGLSSFPRAESEVVDVVEGEQYIVSAWLNCETTRYVECNLNVFDSGGVYQDTLPVPHDAVADEWMPAQGTVTIPAGGARATIAPTIPSGATDEVLYATQVTLRRASPGATPLDFPFDASLGGERVTVEGIGPSVADRFGRTTASGWGAADTGQTWSTTGGSAAQYSVSSGAGRISQGSLNVSRYVLTPQPYPDWDQAATFATDKALTGGSAYLALIARHQDTSNNYVARLALGPGSTVVLSIRKRVAGTESELGTYTTALTHTAGGQIRIRFRGDGSVLRARAWLASGTEPTGWQITVTDTSLTEAGSMGVRAILASGVTTTLPVEARVDNYRLDAPQGFTVVRSVNRITKAHAAGTPVSLSDPAYVAL